MAFDLSAEDADQVAQTLRRFVERELSPRVERPEETLPQTQLAELTEQAVELGLVNLEDEPCLGLWDAPHDAIARQLTIDSLLELAHASAGVALHFHQLALAAHLARRLGCCDGRPAGMDLLGTYGMGRYLLPRLLRGGVLEPEEHAWLADYFAPTTDTPRLLQLGTPTEVLLLADYEAAGQRLCFRRVEAEAAIAERVDTAHGLDETHVAVLTGIADDAPRLCAGDDPHGIATHRAMLELDSLGVCAISVGAQRQSYARASEYAELRVQGGTQIINHAAVQRLLGRTRAAVAAGEMQLRGLSAQALDAGGLERCLSTRATLITEGCRAANDALQVFGGSGYMRDNGMEKLVRDQNHLRVFRGSPRQHLRFVAELARAA